MQTTLGTLKQRAASLLERGEVTAVLGWKAGPLCYDITPAVFTSVQELEALVWNSFCGANLSVFLPRHKEGKTLIPLKPCDAYSLCQQIGEHQVNREAVYAIGLGCMGMLDIEKIRALGARGILEVTEQGETVAVQTLYGETTLTLREVLLEKCLCCKNARHAILDEQIGEEPLPAAPGDRFAQVAELEAMSAGERFAFWRGELSRCIRCNACRNICPVCACRTCVFDNPDSGVDSKTSADTFEENLFHIIRAFHVAGRCTDCGQCSRACPQGIALHLLNRKLIRDINALYGEFQSGEEAGAITPLTSYALTDPNPNATLERGGTR